MAQDSGVDLASMHIPFDLNIVLPNLSNRKKRPKPLAHRILSLISIATLLVIAKTDSMSINRRMVE